MTKKTIYIEENTDFSIVFTKKDKELSGVKASEYLGVSIVWLSKLVQSEKIKTVESGGRKKYLKSELDRYLESKNKL